MGAINDFELLNQAVTGFIKMYLKKTDVKLFQITPRLQIFEPENRAWYIYVYKRVKEYKARRKWNQIGFFCGKFLPIATIKNYIIHLDPLQRSVTLHVS